MIIIVSGLPGSGKSYFAARLALKCDAVYINSDKVRQELKSSGKYSLDDKLLVYKELRNRTAVLIEQNKDVVVDATFYHHTMREMFLKLAKDYNQQIRVIEVTADEKIIKERLLLPRKYSEADFSVYETIRDSFEEITMPHLVLESTNDNINLMLDSAVAYIGN
jgi:predicted kinase